MLCKNLIANNLLYSLSSTTYFWSLTSLASIHRSNYINLTMLLMLPSNNMNLIARIDSNTTNLYNQYHTYLLHIFFYDSIHYVSCMTHHMKTIDITIFVRVHTILMTMFCYLMTNLIVYFDGYVQLVKKSLSQLVSLQFNALW